MTTTTTNHVRTMLEMFTDATAGESYAQNRLITRETPTGNVVLIGYGWMKLAEYDPVEDNVTVFFGHKNVNSRVVSGWLNKILDVATERRDAIISDESPVVGEPNDGVKFIGNYVGDFNDGDKSPVEKAAVAAVENSLSGL